MEFHIITSRGMACIGSKHEGEEFCVSREEVCSHPVEQSAVIETPVQVQSVALEPFEAVPA